MEIGKTKEFVIKNKKSIYIVIFVIIILFVAFGINSVITGFATYNEELEKELENYKNEFMIVNQSFGECINNFDKCMNNLKTYETELKICEKQRVISVNYSKALESILDECRIEKETIRKNYTELMENYKNIIRAYVRTTCCSYDDVWNGVVKNWDLKDNKIICVGNYTVNCTTGETTY